jgi:hypothetical protein
VSLDLEDIEPTTRTDYRRANGAPQVVVDGKGERYSRPSSFADPLDDKSALTNWRIDRGCLGVAGDRALQARWCALDLDDKGQNKEKQKLRDDSISAGRGAQAADIGTALHAMSVRWENDEKFSPPEPYLSSLIAYEAAMNELGLRTERFEFQTVNVEHRCAGTADRLYRLTMPLVTPSGSIIEAGSFVIGDVKTGAKFEYSMPSYAVQMALYAAGQFYNVVTDEFEETPPINQEWGLIVHMPVDEPGTCQFLWCDLEVGRYGCYIVDQIKLWRKNWRAGEFEFAIATPSAPEPTTIGLTSVDESVGGATAPDPLASAEIGLDADRLTVPSDEQLEPVVLAPIPFDPPTFDELTLTDDEPAVSVTEDGGLDELVSWAKLRLSYVAQNEGATKLLMRLWPAGLPTPKQGVKTVDQANEILSLLSKVEADFELGFVEGGPQTVGPRSTRKGK